MGQLIINLPDEVLDELSRKAAQAGFDSPGQFVLARTLQDLTAPSLTADEVDKKLLEAIAEGPSEPLGPEHWAEIRREGQAIVEALRRSER